MGYSEVDGYVSKVEYFDKFPLLGFATEGDGSTTTHYCDYSYVEPEGDYVLLVGGLWNYGLNAGLWNWNGNNDSSNSNSNIGGRILIE